MATSDRFAGLRNQSRFFLCEQKNNQNPLGMVRRRMPCAHFAFGIFVGFMWDFCGSRLQTFCLHPGNPVCPFSPCRPLKTLFTHLTTGEFLSFSIPSFKFLCFSAQFCHKPSKNLLLSNQKIMEYLRFFIVIKALEVEKIKKGCYCNTVYGGCQVQESHFLLDLN